MSAVRSLRYLLWAIGGLAIVSALISIGLQLHLFATPQSVPPSADLVTALIADRAYDSQVYPVIVVGSIVATVLFALIAGPCSPTCCSSQRSWSCSCC